MDEYKKRDVNKYDELENISMIKQKKKKWTHAYKDTRQNTFIIPYQSKHVNSFHAHMT